ncbi:hypothetical protein LCGC14_2240780, partial [marine sediment metagenome]
LLTSKSVISKIQVNLLHLNMKRDI